jgi:hypothetical protein
MPVPAAEAAEICAAGTVAVCIAVPVGLCLAGVLLVGGALALPLCCVMGASVCCLPCALCCCPPPEGEQRVMYTRRRTPVFFTPYGPMAGGPMPGVQEGEYYIVNSTVFTSSTASRQSPSVASATHRRQGVVLTELPDDAPLTQPQAEGAETRAKRA